MLNRGGRQHEGASLTSSPCPAKCELRLSQQGFIQIAGARIVQTTGWSFQGPEAGIMPALSSLCCLSVIRQKGTQGLEAGIVPALSSLHFSRFRDALHLQQPGTPILGTMHFEKKRSHCASFSKSQTRKPGA
eukprot:1150529-Pelagomonas_calceolata.AAC.2